MLVSEVSGRGHPARSYATLDSQKTGQGTKSSITRDWVPWPENMGESVLSNFGGSMARIVKEIEVAGRKLRALFDSGSLRSYIKAEFRPPTSRKVTPITVGLGGKVRRLDERCDLTVTIDGLEFDMTAYAVDELGETEQGPLDAIVGALTMEEWYIKLDPRTGELDLSGLRKREFIEY